MAAKADSFAIQTTAMKVFYLLCIVSLTCLQNTHAQKGLIKGSIVDTSSHKPVANATITLLLQKDSSLVSFSMTGNNGSFILSNLHNGDYRLLITHTSYHNLSRKFSITDTNREVDLGTVIFTDKTKLLDEVVITAEAPPVTLVGDTIQYNAGSFKTKPNASVEDLLKKMPGMKVEKDGSLKAQGEKVKKVLVDGKEFFGNDPKVATKNLPADAVDKVQVYDKLSDQAQLTGFDDGNSEKTINLKLKKDKKKGLFGKLTAGAGTQDRYQGRFNVNSFKGARQLSVIGMANNSNAEGFSVMDALNFSGALSQLKGMGGEINLSISDNDPLAGLIGGNNSGINTIAATGINYNDILGNKTDFHSNYFFNRFNPNRESHLQRQYFTPDNLYKQDAYNSMINLNHRLNMNADIQLDSFNSIKLTAALSQQNTTNNTRTDYSTFTGGNKLNDGYSNNTTDNNGYNINAGILYRKKFHRRGRTFSVNLQGNKGNSSGGGKLAAITSFYATDGSRFNSDTINQNNSTSSGMNGYTARMVYTEPIFRKSLLEFSAASGYNKTNASKNTFDYNKLNGKFDLPNTALSNDFTSAYQTIAGGIRLRKQAKKFNYAAGISLQQATLEGLTTSHSSTIEKTFTNLLPNARFQYQFSKFKTVTFNYNTATTQPAISQLQPVPDNSNQLSVKLGNPALDQEYNHHFRLNASLTNPFKNRSFFAMISLQATQNKIVNSNRINSAGIDSVMPVNTNGVYNMNGYLSYAMPVRFLKGTLEISANSNYNRGKQFLQGNANTIRQWMAAPAIRLHMSPADKFTLGLSAEWIFTATKYALQPLANNKYSSHEYAVDLGWELPKGFFFSSDFNYRITNEQADGFNQRIPIWNMSVSKQLLAFNRGELKLSVNDLLNRNTNISRTANLNYIEDSEVNSLRRFFMLSFTYNLSKTGLDKDNNGKMRLIGR